MNILHVVASIDPKKGGVSASILDRGLEIAKQGNTIEVVCVDDPEDFTSFDYPFSLHCLGPGSTSWNYSPRIRPWLKDNLSRFDAVIIDGLWQYIGFATAKEMRGTGKPYYVFPHGMLDPWFKNTFPLKHLKKWLFWPWSDYRMLRDASKVFFTCEEELNLAKGSFWLYRAKGAVVPLGIKCEFELDSLSANDSDIWPAGMQEQPPPYILFLGRICPKKGCDILISAFGALGKDSRDYHLVMAGPVDANYRKYLDSIASSLGISDRLIWPGMLTGSSKWATLHFADAFVLPSHQENFGIAVVEALASKTSVLISNKVNIWREVQDSGGGIVDDDTLEGVKRLLTKFFHLESDQADNMRHAARRLYVNRFTAEMAAAALLDEIRLDLNSGTLGKPN